MKEKKGELVKIEPERKSVKPKVSPTPEMLIEQAINKNVSIETMERLMVMRTQLKAEQAKEAFFRDLASFQAECPIIKKTKAVGNKSFHYKYAPLDEILQQVAGLLKTYGFSYTIQTKFEQDPPAQIAICIVHHEEGHSESSDFRAPVDFDSHMNTIQKHASALTYAKRYSFCNAFGILTGDEDNDAQGLEDTEKDATEKNQNQSNEQKSQHKYFKPKTEQSKDSKKSSQLEEYNNIEQRILVTIDDKDFPADPRTQVLDWLGEKDQKGNKKYHTIDQVKRFRTNVEALLHKIKEEKKLQLASEDEGKLDDSNFDKTFDDATSVESEQIELE